MCYAFEGGVPRNASIPLMCDRRTGFPTRADLQNASMIRWSCKPSSPGVHGYFAPTTHSAKWSISSANWFLGLVDICSIPGAMNS
jgi:hypothetical protein